ncbi:MAG TPA: M3 family metallopeptidase [Candidatus Limnocylindria bacterium]|nr:M3 family metallopeptidase [Candidatus Limnocylindria bacterium]
MLKTAAASPTPVTAEILEARDRERLERAKAIFARLEALREPFTAETVLAPLNDMNVELTNINAEAGIYTAMHPDTAVRDAAERISRETIDFGQSALQSRALYDALGQVRTDDPLDRRFIELERRDMKRAGVELSDADRAKARELRAKLTKLGQDHARNIRDDTRHITLESTVELEGLPADYVKAHRPGADGKIVITTNPPDMQPFMTYAKSERARKALWREGQDRAKGNVQVLQELTKTRHELARLLGYPTWAHYNLEERMVGTPEQLDRFLNEIEAIARPAAMAEFALLLEEKRLDDPSATTIGEWEQAYYTNRVKTKRFRFDAQEVRPYLEYRKVRQAILDLNAELFNMTFTPVVHEERWHPSVESFDVTIDGKPAGRISLDMHPREGKNKWFFNAPLRVAVPGRQEGHGVLNCNFPDPATVQGPALMEHAQVVTYFHEFGHLVHGLARANIKYTRLSRVSEGDFMEAPSQFLEEWISDHKVLTRFAKHIETGKPIPEDLVKRLRDARDFGRGLRILTASVALSRLSLAMHDGTRPGADPRELAKEIMAKYSPFERLEGTAYPASWEHMNGDNYSAAYYTYLWSNTIAKDLHTAFGGDLMDTSVSLRYRDRILAPGGTKPAAALVEDFLGRPGDLRAFTRWLTGSDA